MTLSRKGPTPTTQLPSNLCSFVHHGTSLPEQMRLLLLPNSELECVECYDRDLGITFSKPPNIKPSDSRYKDALQRAMPENLYRGLADLAYHGDAKAMSLIRGEWSQLKFEQA